LVIHEDKTRNHSDPMGAQTCVILVSDAVASTLNQCSAAVPLSSFVHYHPLIVVYKLFLMHQSG